MVVHLQIYDVYVMEGCAQIFGSPERLRRNSKQLIRNKVNFVLIHFKTPPRNLQNIEHLKTKFHVNLSSAGIPYVNPR